MLFPLRLQAAQPQLPQQSLLIDIIQKTMPQVIGDLERGRQHFASYRIFPIQWVICVHLC